MKTLLIPVDFSDASENVLKYAADFSCDAHIERIIVLKSFYVSVYAELLPSADFVQLSAEDINEERQEVVTGLKNLAKELVKKCNPSTKVETMISELPLLRAIHQSIERERPYMVMIGSDNDLADSYRGEQVIAIAKTSTIPVMIVPNHTHYKKVEKALVPCDFNSVSRLNALQVFSDPTKFMHPHLILLNVNTVKKQAPVQIPITDSLTDLLKGYNYEVHHSEDNDVAHGLLKFADNHHVQMIIALPGKYSFFYNLTHRSITKALALNSHRAVLILK
jgi:nucleotide-binding universal stress UspA family protein